MRGLVADMQAAERRPEIASVSLVHGFPWGDVADMGAQVLVLGDDQRESAALAAAFGHRLRTLRELTFTRPLPLDAALERALAPGPVPTVLADVSDNPRGGAPCHAPVVLDRLLQAHLPTGLGPPCDRAAAAACHAADRQAGVQGDG